jgi:hypothetical protein
MENLVEIKLSTGETIELFKNNGRIVVNLMSRTGYGVDHYHLSETQVEGLRTLVESLDAKHLQPLDDKQMECIHVAGV